MKCSLGKYILTPALGASEDTCGHIPKHAWMNFISWHSQLMECIAHALGLLLFHGELKSTSYINHRSSHYCKTCVFRLDEWTNFQLSLCGGSWDEPHPFWAGIHRRYQPTHAYPRHAQGGPWEPNRVPTSSGRPAWFSHNYHAGSWEDCCCR